MEAAKATGLFPYDAARAETDLESLDKLDRQIEWYEVAIAQANRRKEEIHGRLMDFGISFRQTVGRSRLSLANGSLVIMKRRERIDVTDSAAFREWCIANNYTKSVADESGAKQAITWTPTGDGFHGDGEVVPGVKKFIPGDYDYSVKVEVGEKKIFDDIKDEPSSEPTPAAVATKAAPAAAVESDEARRQKVLAKALAVLEPLGAGSPRYLWAMQETFRSQDWNVIKGFSLNKLDADTRGRITKIVEQAMDTPEELAAKLLIMDQVVSETFDDPTVGQFGNPTGAFAKKKDLIASIREQISRIPEGPAREQAMSNAFGSTSWGELETYSPKEVEEVDIPAGRVEKIVEDAIKASAKGAK